MAKMQNPTKLSAHVGGAFALFGGYIVGRQLVAIVGLAAQAHAVIDPHHRCTHADAAYIICPPAITPTRSTTTRLARRQPWPPNSPTGSWN